MIVKDGSSLAIMRSKGRWHVSDFSYQIIPPFYKLRTWIIIGFALVGVHAGKGELISFILLSLNGNKANAQVVTQTLFNVDFENVTFVDYDVWAQQGNNGYCQNPNVPPSQPISINPIDGTYTTSSSNPCVSNNLRAASGTHWYLLKMGVVTGRGNSSQT